MANSSGPTGVAEATVVLSHLPPSAFVAQDVESELRRGAEHVASVVLWQPEPQYDRIRVQFASAASAAMAVEQLDGWMLHEAEIQAHLLADCPLPRRAAKDTLQVPKLTKQFLISPPPSPPIGWEPVKEDPPGTS